MSSHAPTRSTVCLERLHRLVRRFGYDATRIRRTSSQAEQLEYLHQMLNRIEADRECTFFGRIFTKVWYQKATSWHRRVLSLPTNGCDRYILFISGLPRSGTTFANELLAADDRFRLLTHADLEIDMLLARRLLTWFFADGYEPIDALHPLSSPPEDLEILGQYVLPNMFMGGYGVEYLKGMPESMQEALFEYGYRFEREVFRRLPIRPQQTFVIKSPVIHLMYFEQFKHAFEDCRMMVLVRDIPTSVLSFCNIVESVMKYIKHTDPSSIGPLVLQCIESYVRGLERLTPTDLEKFVFVDFSRFVKDPLAIVSRLYAWMNLDFDDTLAEKFRSRKVALERVHICTQAKPPPSYYHLDLDAVEALRKRYAAVFESRLW